MPASLPAQSNLTQLRNRAKTILKAHKRGDASVCGILRTLERFAGEADWEILDADVSLADVQHALARHYGFRNWRELKAHVETPPGVSGETTQTPRVHSTGSS